MRKPASLALFLVLLPLTAHAQVLYPKKDLAFAQVAAGGGYETVLNVTNRGRDTYNGVLNLYHLTLQVWNPLVNGTRVTGGKLNVVLSKGATASYRITQDGGTEAGFAIIVASDLALDNYLEGTLTYYIRSSSGALVDSVGVQPSSEIYLTAIPFDDFSRLALALANPNSSRATLKLSLYSDTNARVSALDQPLAPGEHKAVYLWQLFPGVQMTKGRLEILSDVPVFGTALTDIGGQFSSLPLLPGVKDYTFNIAGFGYSGGMSLWFDGPYVQGYVRATTINGVPDPQPDTIYLSGTFVDGVLQLCITGHPESEQQLSYIVVNPFSLSQATVQATWTGWWLSSRTLIGTATATLTATN